MKRCRALDALLVLGRFSLCGAFMAACSFSNRNTFVANPRAAMSFACSGSAAADPRMAADLPSNMRGTAYYGEGGAMDKRLIKVEAEVQSSLAASSLVLIDGACLHLTVRKGCALFWSPYDKFIVAGDNLRAACGWRVSPEHLACAIDHWAGDRGARFFGVYVLVCFVTAFRVRNRCRHVWIRRQNAACLRSRRTGLSRQAQGS